jgi:hypothetical protein
MSGEVSWSAVLDHVSLGQDLAGDQGPVPVTACPAAAVLSHSRLTAP